MNERRMQFAVGVVALGSVFVAVILAMINSPIPGGIVPWGSGSYQIAILLPQAPGVGPDTPVRKNGLLIGRVASIEDVDDGVAVYANIDEGRTLTTKHVPHVRTTVLGDATIDFATAPFVEPPRTIAAGDSIPGVVDPNPFDSISKLGDLQDDIQQAMAALADAGRSVDQLAQRVNTAFGSGTDPGRVKRLLDSTETAMVQFASVMTAMNQIIGDGPVVDATGQPLPGQVPIDGRELRNRLRQGLSELPSVITDARTTLSETRNMVQSADRNFRNLEGFTKPLGENGQEIAMSMVSAVDGLEKLVEEFTVLTSALNSREGTIGQLIHNPELYQNLNRLTGNANVVLEYFYDLLKGLRPTIENVRIFTHKIAIEPGRLIGGAVNPSQIK